MALGHTALARALAWVPPWTTDGLAYLCYTLYPPYRIDYE